MKNRKKMLEEELAWKEHEETEETTEINSDDIKKILEEIQRKGSIGPRCPYCGAPVNPLCQPLRIFF